MVTGAFVHLYAGFRGLFGTFRYVCFFTREETFKRKEPIITVQKKEAESCWQEKWTEVDRYEKQSKITQRKVMRPGFHL